MGWDATEEQKKLARKLGISIRSGHGPGKTASLALLYFWLMSIYPNALGYVTAPTSHQLESILWKEFRVWKSKSRFLTEKFDVQSDKVFLKEAKGVSFIQARTTNIKASEEEQAETLSGQHADYMILAADEASGLPYAVFKPLEGALTGIINFLVLISNPTRARGYFFDTHTKDSERWICLHWNSEDSPLVTQDSLIADREKYGRDSNWYRVRRLGEFPLADIESLIPYDWVLDAVDREFLPMDNDKVLKGIDVGAGGDDSIVVTRRGGKVTDIAKFNNPDTMATARWILSELGQDNWDEAFIDPIGYGAGVYDYIRERGVDITPMDVRATSTDSNCFKKRDEIFWKLRTVFEKGLISIPNDDELIGELTTIRYNDPDSTKGKIKIESKKEMRLRGLHSPNKADALALTYCWDDESYLNRKPKKKTKLRPVNWKTV
jgi:phage terminase large subunit